MEKKQLIKEAHAKGKKEGSSTLVLIALARYKSHIYTSYIGDSGYCIFRKSKYRTNSYKTIFESKPQLKGFNFPFQIGSIGDDPKCAKSITHKFVKNNDIIISATDGLFDNLYVWEILNIINNNV